MVCGVSRGAAACRGGLKVASRVIRGGRGLGRGCGAQGESVAVVMSDGRCELPNSDYSGDEARGTRHVLVLFIRLHTCKLRGRWKDGVDTWRL